MSQELISTEFNKDVCEALGCFAKATIEITVKVGKLGTISLLLCENCVTKFKDC